MVHKPRTERYSKYEAEVIDAIASDQNVDILFRDFHPFSLACQIGSMRLLRELSRIGGNVNYRNRDGTTALYWAPNSQFTRFLIDMGAKVSAEKPRSNYTSLHLAASAGRTDPVRLLFNGAGGAAALELFDEIGRTPLACAAQEGHEDVVRLLLSFGANPLATSTEGVRNALEFAQEEGYAEISRILIAATPVRDQKSTANSQRKKLTRSRKGASWSES